MYQSEKPVSGGVWLDALTSVLKRVPVYNAVLKEVDHRLLPILDGRIEGAAPDKVFYLSLIHIYAGSGWGWCCCR